uniref:Uncharacterized protein n=1 Tax=Anopheles culicifacies TaxID=139723 RepID=A0A182MBH7_9DIPT
MKRQPPRHGMVTQHRSDSPHHSSSGSSPVINFGNAVPYGTSQHNYTLCYPHYPSSSGAGSSYSGSSAANPAPIVPRSASPLASSSRAYTNQLLNSTNSSGNDTTKKLNRLSTSSSLSIITPPTTPKRPAGGGGGATGHRAAGSSSGSTGRLKMALSASLAQNFNQKLANLNDKWNDFSFLLLKAGGGASTSNEKAAGPSGSVRTNVRNDSYHSIESAVTCTAADFEAGNFYHRESESESNQEFRTTQQQQREPSGSRAMAGPSRSRDQRQRKPRLRSSRRNSASGDPKEFDMLVLKPIDTGDDDNESF